MMPVIALVGRPNVGKSTLFNAITRSRDALVADSPGLTRDRKYGHGNFDGNTFVVVDTGGLSGEKQVLDDHMARQTRLAVDESDTILFLVDAREGLTASDENIALELRKTGKKIITVVNKVDGLNEQAVAAEFYNLGLGELVTVSAAHNRGVHKLLQTSLADFDFSAPHESSADDDDCKPVRVAFVGRPNVGKSTLVNRFLGEERVVVFDMPGTTRDSIYIPFSRDNREYVLIDTAGVRRKRSVSDAVEKFSIIKTMQAIDEANVVVMMIDAQTEIADQDLHLLGYIVEAGRALVLVINKWDNLDDYQRQTIRTAVDKQLGFVRFAEIFYISALHGSSVGNLYGAIDRAYASAMSDLSTHELSKILQQAVTAHQPPLVKGRRIKLRYAHQGGVNPPRIVIHGNQTEVPATYRRYLANVFHEATGVVGTPVLIEFRTGANPYAGRANSLTRRQQAKRERMMRHVKKRGRQQKRRK